MNPHYSSPYAPLSGTTPSQKGLFIDRWGTILEAPSAGQVLRPEEITFTRGALPSLFRAARAGWRIYLIGNESPLAQGQIEEAAWLAVEERIERELAGAGVRIARSYVCLDHPQGIGKHQNDSVYFLPNTGAFYHAAHVDGLELRRSWVVGDSTTELVAGWRSGLRIAGVRTGQGLRDRTFVVEPEFVGEDLSEVLGVLLDAQERQAA